MQLAHTLGTGGPEIELLVVAVALIVLGVMFFMRRTASPRASTLTLLAGLALGAGSFIVSGPTSSAEGIDLSITSPADGDAVPAGAPVKIEVDLRGASLTRSQDSSNPTAGHLHVFVDDKLDSMPTGAQPTIELDPGEHTVVVEFVDSRHVSYSPRVTDAIEVRAESGA
jgi:hypothetical protein